MARGRANAGQFRAGHRMVLSKEVVMVGAQKFFDGEKQHHVAEDHERAMDRFPRA